MIRIAKARVLSEHRVALELTNGESIERDLQPYLSGPVFESIRSDSRGFAKLYVDVGTIVWPNGADLCPDVVIFGGSPPESRQNSGTEELATSR